jgi:Tetracyclin repressor-like, C-terminal domain
LFDSPWRNRPNQSHKLGVFAALSTGPALDPALLKLLQDGFKEWQRRLEHDVNDPTVASVVRVAVDGLWFAEVLQLGVPNNRLWNKMVAFLVDLTKDQ